ncbi:methyltransferase, UbiE/COQ5 family, selenocysteine-containing domain protein [[Clostridium] sordellii VPI 9048]|nr:methyltransferase, UbiE/COQ5 family, selenocysteine-containing domain protein [[Clostridium] sordellii VPI 9048] [Paeniclostridium sordellii VPI 9048]
MEVYLRKSGFKNIKIDVKPVSKEYEEKWGHNLNVGEYIMSASVTANK